VRGQPAGRAVRVLRGLLDHVRQLCRREQMQHSEVTTMEKPALGSIDRITVFR
jgi:hypothetical protein